MLSVVDAHHRYGVTAALADMTTSVGRALTVRELVRAAFHACRPAGRAA